MASASRDFTMVVGPGGAIVPVVATTDDACQTTLSVAGSYAQYDWLPGGTDFALDLGRSDGNDDVRRAPRRRIVLQRARCGHDRAAGSGVPDSGRAVDLTQLRLGLWYVRRRRGVEVSAGRQPLRRRSAGHGSGVREPGCARSRHAGTRSRNCGRRARRQHGRPLRDAPARLRDELQRRAFIESVQTPKSSRCGAAGSRWAAAGEAIARQDRTRAQMAVFLQKAKHGPDDAPPPCSGVFADVACPSAFADWIERLAAEGITGGCGGREVLSGRGP